jgi:SAM-dependent methyltransferase
MRKKTIELITCPNTHKGAFDIYGKEVLRGNQLLHNLDHRELADDDKIKTGVLVNGSSGSVYPIIDSVAVLLGDDDVDYLFLKKEFAPLLDDCPIIFKTVIEKYLARIEKKKKSGDGGWNLEEMRYYDKGVDTDVQREKMLADIKMRPIWRLFIPRKNQITRFLEPAFQDNYLLEIGCGNARTISWIFPPAQFNYHYIGIDISFKRLLVAKRNIPEGDFIQASALNLPFKNNSFHAIVSFGMLHHLPRPLDCIRHLNTKIRNSGFLAFHEPMIKPKMISETSILKKFLNTYEHSEHDNEIDSKKSLALLKALGYKIVNLKYYNSVFKTFIEILLRLFPKKIRGSKLTTKLITVIDVIFLKAVGKISKLLGPHAIIGVFKKG